MAARLPLAPVDGDWQDFSGEITLPPQSAAVII